MPSTQVDCVHGHGQKFINIKDLQRALLEDALNVEDASVREYIRGLVQRLEKLHS